MAALAGTAVCEWEDACVVEVEAIGSEGETGIGLPELPDWTLERGGAEEFVLEEPEVVRTAPNSSAPWFPAPCRSDDMAFC